MDKQKLEQLIDILTNQCGVLRELVDVAEQQKQALLQTDQSGVEATTKQQEELFTELHRLEEERLALVSNGRPAAGHTESVGASGGVADGEGPESVTLQQLIDDAPEELRGTLVELRDEARSLVDRLSALNETNAQLLQQELALIGLYMSVLSPDAGVDVYGDPVRGKRPAGGSSVAFDARA